jgi:hypothetical protein
MHTYTPTTCCGRLLLPGRRLLLTPTRPSPEIVSPPRRRPCAARGAFGKGPGPPRTGGRTARPGPSRARRCSPRQLQSAWVRGCVGACCESVFDSATCHVCVFVCVGTSANGRSSMRCGAADPGATPAPPESESPAITSHTHTEPSVEAEASRGRGSAAPAAEGSVEAGGKAERSTHMPRTRAYSRMTAGVYARERAGTSSVGVYVDMCVHTRFASKTLPCKWNTCLCPRHACRPY